MSEDREHPPLPVPADEAAPVAVAERSHAVAAVAGIEPTTSPLHEYIGLFLRRKGVVLASVALVFGLTCFVTATSPRIYEASAILLVTEAVGQGSGASSGGTGLPAAMAGGASPDLQTQVGLIGSTSTAEATVDWLKAHGGPDLSPAAVLGSVRASVVGQTHLVRLHARAASAEGAQMIANAAASAYVELNRRRAQGSSDSASRYLGEQLKIAKENLTNSERALQAFRESTHTVAQDAAAGDLLARAASLRADLDRTNADLIERRQLLARVRAELARQNKSIAASHVRDNAVVQQLRAKLVDLEGQRLIAQSQYTGALSAPVDQIDEQIRVIRSQLDAEIANVVRAGGGDLATQQSLVTQLVQGEAQVAALGARLGRVQSELARSEADLTRIPARQVALARFQRQLDVAQTIYSQLLERSQQIEVGRVMALGNAEVVQLAGMPGAPTKPNVPLNLVFGLLFGLTVGVGLALLQEQLDDRVRGEEDVVRHAGAPVIGLVPVLPPQDIAVPVPPSHHLPGVSDAYRGLRVNLGFVTPGRGGRAVLVASPAPREGKTITALYLARAAAQSGRRVVLVDADMRRPVLHHLLGIDASIGLSDLLAGQAELEDVLRSVDGTGLRVIGSGRRAPNPTDLLDSDAMRRLVQQLRQQADLVIFDSPPMLAAADALIVAHLSDAVLMVCVPGASRRREMQRARLLLGHVGRSVSGVVLNKVECRQGYGYYGYYYGQYDGHGGDASESDGDQDARTEGDGGRV